MKTNADDPVVKVTSTLAAVAACKHRSRLRNASLLAAAGISLAWFCVTAVDWFVAWQSGPGRMLGPTLVSLTALVFCWRILRLHRIGPDHEEAARVLDAADHDSRDRWITFASLQREESGATGSPAMRAALVREVAPRCDRIGPASVDPTPWPRFSMGLLSVSLLAALGFFILFLDQGSSRLIPRFLLPWADLPLTRLDAPAPPDRILKGSALEIEASVIGKKPETVWLEWEESRAEDDSLKRLSTSIENPRFELENLSSDFRYRLLAGDFTGEWQEVGIATRPRLTGVTLKVADPPYSKKPPRSWSRFPSSIRAIRGSELYLDCQSDKTIARAVLEVSGTSPRTLFQDPARKYFGYRLRLNHSLAVQLSFTCNEGYDNSELPVCRIEVVADQPPEVNLTDQTDRNVPTLQHDLQVAFQARDDVGVETAEVIFKIRSPRGEEREVVVPLDLGEQAGNPEVNLKTNLPLSELGLEPGEDLAFSVRVRDNSNQASSERNGQNSQGKEGGPDNPPNEMTMRTLPGGGSSAESKSRQLRVTSQELINQVEPREKKLLAVDKVFELLRKHTESALFHTRKAKAPEPVVGRIVDSTPLFRSVELARKDIQIAGDRVSQVSQEAAGTPYAFLSFQMENFLQSYLEPAADRLDDSVRSRLRELPPREAHRLQAENLLQRGLQSLQRLTEVMSEERSKVEAEIAMTELMTMYVAQVEDIPVLMSEGGAGSPYQRTPGEVDRAQAEAALKRLEAKKDLYRKTGELLKEHPELWRRYLDKSQSESSIYRDQLESLGRRHGEVAELTLQVITGDNDDSSLKRLIASHQKNVGTTLLRTLEKAQTWLPESSESAPEWMQQLEGAALQILSESAIQAEATDDREASSHPSTRGIDHAIEALSQLVEQHRGQSDGRFYALRLGELNQARDERDLTKLLLSSLQSGEWRNAALLEQATIAHQTQELAGKIEVSGARLQSLADEVDTHGERFHALMNEDLLPELGRSVRELQPVEGQIQNATSAQAEAKRHFSAAIRALDEFVAAAIREKDKAPAVAQAGVAGAPKITAESLEELEAKLEEEQEISESFGIPCCRPTNFQVMSDWQPLASQCQSGSSSPAPSPGRESSPSSDRPTPPQNQAEAAGNDAGEKSSPNEMAEDSTESQSGAQPSSAGTQRSQMDVASLEKLRELAKEASLHESESLAASLSGSEQKKEPETRVRAVATVPGPAAGVGTPEVEQGPFSQGQPGPFEAGNASVSDWNRLGSQLQREMLQGNTDTIPEAYRSQIEAHFRRLSRWKEPASTTEP